MRTPPTKDYAGTTLVLHHPSRLDKDHLLTGIAGQWINDECLPFPLEQCDVRLSSVDVPLLPGSKRVALFGFPKPETPVGYPTLYKGIRAIHTYAPQDCCDHKQLEIGNDDEESTFSDRDTKDNYPTSRANQRFWTQWHLQKLHKAPIVSAPLKPKYFPQLPKINEWLNCTQGQDLYIDIETSRAHQCITCIGLSSSSSFPDVWVVPVYLYNGRLAYENFHTFFKALALALLRNTVVAHNAAFDLLILHAFYKFPLPSKVYDTMLANHRIVPEAEKSLAHCISMWTWELYHKDTATQVYSQKAELKMWEYNARDVYNLKLIKDAQTTHASSDRGLINSIAQANSSLIPYLRTSVTGMRLDQVKLNQIAAQLSLAKTQYARICQTLTGNTTFNPGSTKQCTNFFHNKLNYPVQMRGERGAPKLGRKQLYQLMLKFQNPLIPAILKYRNTAKELSMLESELWSTP